MATADISKQWDNASNTIYKDMYHYIVPSMVQFGIKMVNGILPSQTEFANLTGNTITSLAFGVYYMGKLEVMGFNKHYPPPIRNKLVKGESVYDFEDYDGNTRQSFTADLDTDGGYGADTSMKFLRSYKPGKQFSIVFTTGTEYSEYIENKRHLNVLSEGYDTSIGIFLKSFKPIKK